MSIRDGCFTPLFIRLCSPIHFCHVHISQVFIVSDMLQRPRSRCSTIVWLDSDAVVARRPAQLADLLNWTASIFPSTSSQNWDNRLHGSVAQARDRRYKWPENSPRPIGRTPHMALAGDNDQYQFELSPFNAGVWVISNSDIGRHIMRAWRKAWEDHAHDHWRLKNSSKWECLQRDPEHGAIVPCTFGREHYEQGAFVKHVLTNRKFEQHIRLVPWPVLQSHHPRTLVNHFVGPTKTKHALIADVSRYHGGLVT
jgi:hypothetical protein